MKQIGTKSIVTLKLLQQKLRGELSSFYTRNHGINNKKNKNMVERTEKQYLNKFGIIVKLSSKACPERRYFHYM